MSSSCSFNDDSDGEFEDNASHHTNSSSAYSYLNSSTTYSYTTTTSSNYSLNDKRRSRNQNEKKRRDEFNSLINQLGKLLNQNHARKIDKSTVLSETLSFFKNTKTDDPHYNQEIDFKYKPFFLANDEFMRFMIEFQNAFCLVFDLSGQIKYVSDHVMPLLGHYPKNLTSCMMYDLIDEKSGKELKSMLMKKKFAENDKFHLTCRFKKASIQSNSYEAVEIKGFFKHRSSTSESACDHFNTIVKLDAFLSISQLYPQDNNKREFTSEFSFDMKYISLDPKAPEIVGYSPIELLGTLIYDYCHHEDLEKLIDSHQKLLNDGAVPTVSYRYRTKGQQWLWLETRFELLNNGYNCKNYAILTHNKVITLNEMLVESHEIVDTSSSTASFYDQSTPIAHLLPASDPASLAATDNNNTIVVKNERRSPTSSKILDDIDASASNVFEDSTKFETKSDSSSSEKPVEQEIDEDLDAIFLRSFQDTKYRNYVLKQLRMKKAQIERMIRKQQDDLRVLETSIGNIMDDKKLDNWYKDFKNQVAKQNQQQEHNKDQKHQFVNDDAAASGKKSSSSSSSHKTTSLGLTKIASSASSVSSSSAAAAATHKLPHIPSYSSTASTDSSSSLLSFIMPSLKSSDLLTTKQQQQQNENETSSKTRRSSTPDVSSGSSKRPRLSVAAHARMLENSSAINEIVGDLINLQNMMPSSNESQPDEGKSSGSGGAGANATAATPSGGPASQSRAAASTNNNFDMIDDDISSEMIDKLFNQYSFDSFNSQQ